MSLAAHSLANEILKGMGPLGRASTSGPAGSPRQSTDEEIYMSWFNIADGGKCILEGFFFHLGGRGVEREGKGVVR